MVALPPCAPLSEPSPSAAPTSSSQELAAARASQIYQRGAAYLEIDTDIGSSQIAAGVVRLCGGYAKALVVDISFVIEGKRDDELPEQILGTIQIRNLDVTKGRPLPT